MFRRRGISSNASQGLVACALVFVVPPTVKSMMIADEARHEAEDLRRPQGFVQNDGSEYRREQRHRARAKDEHQDAPPPRQRCSRSHRPPCFELCFRSSDRVGHMPGTMNVIFLTGMSGQCTALMWHGRPAHVNRAVNTGGSPVLRLRG